MEVKPSSQRHTVVAGFIDKTIVRGSLTWVRILPSQDGFPQSWNTPAFMISYLNPKATTKVLLSMNRRQMIVFKEEYGQGSLSCPSCWHHSFILIFKSLNIVQIPQLLLTCFFFSTFHSLWLIQYIHFFLIHNVYNLEQMHLCIRQFLFLHTIKLCKPNTNLYRTLKIFQ